MQRVPQRHDRKIGKCFSHSPPFGPFAAFPENRRSVSNFNFMISTAATDILTHPTCDFGCDQPFDTAGYCVVAGHLQFAHGGSGGGDGSGAGGAREIQWIHAAAGKQAPPLPRASGSLPTVRVINRRNRASAECVVCTWPDGDRRKKSAAITSDGDRAGHDPSATTSLSARSSRECRASGFRKSGNNIIHKAAMMTFPAPLTAFPKTRYGV